MADAAPAPDFPPPPDLTGRTLGDFQVLRKIGQGGMGQVYLARQLSLKREVALKLLRDDLAANPTMLKRFQAEAEAIARISHPNIVQVYAIGEHDGLRFMALEYVDGRNLRDFLSRKGPPELPVALAIMRQVGAALQKAGELGIVHRDIKPENILLTRKVEVKVTDFGLSRLVAGDQLPLNLTQSGVTLGTPLYMAPEQVRGIGTDHRSDLYSFGVTCFHLLAGEPPFMGLNAIDVAMKHVNDPAPLLSSVRPDLPADLSALVAKLMAKKPDDRYQTARAMLRDLARVRDGLPLGIGTSVPSALSVSMPGVGSGFSIAHGGTSTIQLPMPAEANAARWPTRILSGIVFAGAAALGWWAFAKTQPTTTTPNEFIGAGLPDAQLPQSIQLVSQRERELLAKRRTRGSSSDEVIDASLELGLLYLNERRYADAEKVFQELEKEKFDTRGKLAFGAMHIVAAKCGQAMVLSSRDQAKDSFDAFRAALGPAPRGVQVRFPEFLAKHLEFAEAIAEALHRNSTNLKSEKIPTQLEFLASPTTLFRGGKN